MAGNKKYFVSEFGIHSMDLLTEFQHEGFEVIESNVSLSYAKAIIMDLQNAYSSIDEYHVQQFEKNGCIQAVKIG